MCTAHGQVRHTTLEGVGWRDVRKETLVWAKWLQGYTAELTLSK